MKSLTNALSKKWTLLTLISIFIFSACQKQIEQPQDHEDRNTTSGDRNEMAIVKTINVSNLDQLYDAINDPENSASRIVLSTGVYILNASYPNAGRLELLENMTLRGQPGHPEQVIIDASQLPAASFNPPLNFPAVRTGAIRMGRGSNAIEWLTVKGNSSATALSVIDTDLIWAGGSHIRIAHSIVTGGRIGIDIRNVGIASAGRILETEITDNELVENQVQFGQGIEIQNANGASGAVIHAILNGNYVHGNKIGLRAFNNNANNTKTDFGSITIQSKADRFEGNGIGIYLSAGLNQGANTTANGNLLSFEAYGTSIRNNSGTLPPEAIPACEIYAVGGLSTIGGIASHNKLEVNFSGCIISGNNRSDIISYGAFSFAAVPAGINNVVEIQLHGVSKNATVATTSSLPIELAGTNSINIFR